MQVAALMTAPVIACAPDESLRGAARRMADHHCGCLPVTAHDDGGQQRLIGIVTDRDLACRGLAAGLDADHAQVHACMSFPVQTIAADADLGACAERFTTTGVRRLVVIDAGGRYIGVISRCDLQRYVTDSTAGAGESTHRPQEPCP